MVLILKTDSEKKKRRGKEEEIIAGQCLESSGWVILARNFRSRRGEIDIVALRENILSFVEVKSANRITKRDLEHVIGVRKRNSIIETSKLFLVINRKYKQYHIRYDVMLIQENACLRHIEGAFAEDNEAKKGF
ncbi:MAG: hypothetical protein BWX81_00786 [Spirochaetes bacterium ADurb.Bin110]|jgi:putative endonuclease|nr:MAG: hypothetical protein BWX81_00786 [Spirochaetes bacterium ADurb.Bin110]